MVCSFMCRPLSKYQPLRGLADSLADASRRSVAQSHAISSIFKKDPILLPFSQGKWEIDTHSNT